METLYGILMLIGAYLIGNIDFGYFLVKQVKHKDIRTEGSGNPGTANVLRTQGLGMAVAVFFGDFLKGSLAVFLARAFGFTGWWLAGSVIAVVCGHNWPALLKFKGGKGVATSGGAFLVFNWHVAIWAIIIAALLMFIFKYVSLGSIVGNITLPIATLILYGTSDLPLLTAATVLAVMSVVRHWSNIDRLVHGTERKLTDK